MARPTTYTFSVVLLLAAVGEAAIFTVVNQCPDTVWPASVPVGGGRRLNPGEAWNFSVPAGTTGARVWARTGCSFDASGRGSCQTGDCGGALACTAYGRPPNTLAEFVLNQFNNQDFFDISLVDGFNVPMALEPDSSVCAGRGPRCAANITAQCPDALRAPGGCNSACTALKQDVYCCTGSYASNCPQTDYSRFFKNLCPDAYSNPRDDSASTLTCRGGTNYKVTFCPSS